MKSFFRSAADITSSSAGDTSAVEDDEPTDASHALHNVKTISSDSDSGALSAIVKPSQPQKARTQEQHKDVMLHSLLEDKALIQALESLNVNPSGRIHKTTDPEVRELAKSKYRYMTEQLSSLGVLPAKYNADSAKDLRHRYRQGLDYISQQHDIEKGAIPGRSAPNVLPSMLSREALTTTFRQLGISPDSSRPATPPEYLQLHTMLPVVLQPFVESHPIFNSSRFRRDFISRGILGKGGYGKVYKVFHKLDGMEYAIKQIVLSPSRMEKIQTKGQSELDEVLKELRSMARLEHPNIVRYYGGWLEFTHDDIHPFTSVAATTQAGLLEAPPETPTSNTFETDGASRLPKPGLRSDGTDGGNIVFEASSDCKDSNSFDQELAHSSRHSNPIYMGSTSHDRWPIENTVSSAHSKTGFRSTIRSAGGDEIDEDADEEIESIPRDLRALDQAAAPHFQTETSNGTFDSSIAHQSEIPRRIQNTQDVPPQLMLHIQMGLHPMTLGHFLASPSADAMAPTMLRHCFHSQISLKLLLSILDGVQYLHSVGVVHRDLKPTNIFLSIYDGPLAPAGCISLYDCAECSRAGLAMQGYLGVKIGDFGLVTSIARPEEGTAACAGKPVGTEFYRPPACSGMANEKLDVYALGVIGFELLWKFGTRMERHEKLSALKTGQFPSCFSENLGRMGKEIEDCLKKMIECDEARRFTCDQVREGLSKIIISLSAQ